jgi:hypothetical protein
MENPQQIQPIVLEKKTISASNLLLLHALLKHSGLLILDCYQLIMLNSHYLAMTANKTLKRQAQRKHCKNWKK